MNPPDGVEVTCHRAPIKQNLLRKEEFHMNLPPVSQTPARARCPRLCPVRLPCKGSCQRS